MYITLFQIPFMFHLTVGPSDIDSVPLMACANIIGNQFDIESMSGTIAALSEITNVPTYVISIAPSIAIEDRPWHRDSTGLQPLHYISIDDPYSLQRNAGKAQIN